MGIVLETILNMAYFLPLRVRKPSNTHMEAV